MNPLPCCGRLTRGTLSSDKRPANNQESVARDGQRAPDAGDTREARALGERLAALERLQERIAESRELSLQTLGTIAVLAGPRLRSVLVAALPAVMRIPDLDQLEVLLPIRPLLLKGC